MANPLEASLRLRDEFTKVLSKIDNQLQKTTGTMENFKQRLQSQSTAFSAIARSAQSAMTKLNSAFQKGFSAVQNMVQSSVQRIVTLMGNFGNRIRSSFNLNPLISKVSETFSKITSTIKSKVSSVFSSLKDVGSKIAKTLKLDTAFNAITKGLDTLKSKVSTTASAIASSFSNIFKSKRVKALDDINAQLDKLSNKKAHIEVNVANAERAQKRLVDVDSAISKLNSKKAKVETQIAGVEKATSQLATVNSNIEKLNSKKATVEAKLAGGEDVSKELTDINNRLTKLTSKRAQLEIKANAVDVEKASQKLEGINAKLNKLNGLRATLQVEANKVEGARKKLAEVQQDIHRLNREKASLQLNINPFTRALSSARSAFDSFKNTVSNGIRNMGTAFKNFGDNMRNSFSHMSSTAGKVQSVFGGIMTALGVTAALGAIKNGIAGISEELNTNSKAWQVFQDNMSMLGKGQGEIDTVKKSLQEFATQTIYNASDMASTYSQMAAIGVKDTENLVKGMAGLASSAEAPGQAMKTLSQQMTQAMAKPELQWMDFKLMMEQAPAGMAQVAKEMGYSLDDFIIAIQDSEIASEDFAAAVAKVGTNEHFSKMATEFKTIGQAMDGMRESLANKLEPAFSVFNETGIRAVVAFTDALDRINFDGMANKLKAFTDTLDFDAIVDGLAGFASKAKAKITDFMDGFKSTGAIDSFVEALKSAWEALKHVAENIDFKAIGKIAGEVVDTFSKITKAVGDFVSGIDPNAIGKISTAIAGLAAAFVAFKAVKGVFDIGKGLFNVGGAVTQLFGDLFGGKKGIKTPKGNPLEEAMPKGMSGSGGLGFLDNLGKTANQFAKGAKNIALIYGVIKLIEELAEAMKQVNDKVPADLSNLGPKLGNMAIALTGMGTFVGVAGAIAKNNFGNAVKGLAVVAGLSGNIMLAAEAMKQIESKVPENMASFAPKLANMAIAISGMGVLVAVAGKFATTNPVSAITGLALVAGISGELMLAAEAMQQVNDKVTDNIGSFASKVANIAIGIGGMFALVQIVGTLAALNPIGTIAGLATVALIAGELILVAEAMKQVNDKVPDDVGNFKNKINNMASAINAFNETDFGGIVEIVQNALAGLNFVVITDAIDKMIDLANKLNQLNEIEVSADVSTKINQIESAISAFDMSSLTDVIASLTTTIDLTVLNTAIDRLIEIAGKLAELNAVEVNADTAKAKVSGIMDVLTALDGATLAELIGAALEASQLEKAVSSINSMVSMASPINTLASSEINAETATANITKIQSVVDTLKESILSGIFTDIMAEGDLNDALASVQAMQSLVSPINGMANSEINAELANANIEKIKSVYSQLRTGKLSEIFTDLLTADKLTEALQSVQAIQALVTPINGLANSTVNSELATEVIGKVKDVFNKLRRGFLEEVFTDLITAKEFGDALASVQAIKALVTPINGLANATVNSELAITVIDNIKNVIDALSDNVLTAWLENPITTDKIEEVRSAIQGMQSLVTPINGIANSTVNSELAVTVIGNIKSVITAMNGISVEMGDDITGQLETVKTAISKLQEVGNAVNAFSQGVFDFAGALNQINQIKNIITQLNALPASTGVEGLQGLISTFNQLTTAINSFSTQSAVSIDGLISAFSRLGSSSNMMSSITSQAVTRMTVAFQSGMTSIRAIVTSGMSAISSSAVSGMARFNSAISSGISRAAATARSGSSQISSAFNALNGQLYTAGLFAMAGLSSGISSGAGRAIAAARSVANSVSSTIRTALKIHSPSRVMIAIGEFVSEGLANGITSASKLVDKASTKLADLAVPRLDAFTAPQMELAGVTRSVTDVYAGQGDYDWDDARTVTVDSDDIDKMNASLSQPIIVKNRQVAPVINLNIEGKDAEDIDTDEIIRRLEDIIIDANNDDLG